jgi:hypothetical protein
MLAEIGSEGNIPKFIERAKDKNDSFRLMGFGHRVREGESPRGGAAISGRAGEGALWRGARARLSPTLCFIERAKDNK